MVPGGQHDGHLVQFLEQFNPRRHTRQQWHAPEPHLRTFGGMDSAAAPLKTISVTSSYQSAGSVPKACAKRRCISGCSDLRSKGSSKNDSTDTAKNSAGLSAP